MNYLLAEGIGTISATAVFKNAPHPNTALLFARWAMPARRDRKPTAEGGRTPAHPKVEPVEKTRPEAIYADRRGGNKRMAEEYEKIWKEIFKLR